MLAGYRNAFELVGSIEVVVNWWRIITCLTEPLRIDKELVETRYETLP
mgnify:CR=1 FL=1